MIPKKFFQLHFGAILSLAVLFVVLQCSGPPHDFDLILRNGMVIDGTGAPGIEADVAIREGTIAAVGRLGSMTAEHEINITGLHVAPGFIDLHSHADEGFMDSARAGAINFLTQGVTTAVVGQDGGSAWPPTSTLAEQIDLWQSNGIGLNVVPLVGHYTIRRKVMGKGCELADSLDIIRMARQVETALENGAWGLSTGIEFLPCTSFRELVEITRPVAQKDAVHFSHIRNESDAVLEAVRELVRVGEITGSRNVISHIKADNPENWGKAEKITEILDSARKAGIQIYADLYPYTTSGSGYDVTVVPGLGLISLPEGYPLEPPDELHGWLADSRLENILRDEVSQEIRERGGAEYLVISRYPDTSLVDRTLAEVAEDRGLSVVQTAIDLTVEGAGFMHRQISEDDIAVFIQQPYVAASSDGWIPRSIENPHHPRSYGAFTSRLRRFVRELQVVTLPFAVHTATGLAAEIGGLPDRGLIKEGYAADLVVFDASAIGERATYGDPHQHSEGIHWVLVNGEIVIENGKSNGIRAGQVLLR